MPPSPTPPPSSSPPPANEPEKTSWWQASLELWRDYPWFARGATILLVAVALLNIAVNAYAPEPCDFWPVSLLPAHLQSALSSDGMLTLATLMVALGIGLHLKERQIKGLLDGTDHYDIGRALAFGYFSNFLVAALLLVRQESERQQRKLVFRMVFPRSVNELENFKRTVAPAIRQLTKKRELEGVYRSGAPLVKRSLLVISKVSGPPPCDEDIFFDFPTTLYTLHDYYNSWNKWLEDNDRAPLAEATIDRLEERQVQAFKRHLLDLSQSSVGLGAVSHLGLNHLEDLKQLFEDHFMDITPEEMVALVGESEP